ncbi:uncharacterized protein BX664DRAFT_17198 [Halteromyces radiatus]|uniref:uncharacterized protein n=1 Tax=Halteromyces radiatus TaxID=101107 RepID=UPI002220AC02|nr:uncharacterized protein BX664DRAFT_17198 [Halteromyces radiatus]KAI8099249.1 hypothetical protein BX664DRAFT_17198 [Halteromyces radiatus]
MYMLSTESILVMPDVVNHNGSPIFSDLQDIFGDTSPLLSNDIKKEKEKEKEIEHNGAVSRNFEDIGFDIGPLPGNDEIILLSDAEENVDDIASLRNKTIYGLHNVTIFPFSPSNQAVVCDDLDLPLPNQAMSCHIDCVIELIMRVILKRCIQENIPGNSEMDTFMQCLQNYAISRQYAQGLELARNFLWTHGFVSKNAMGDCRDVLHVLFDNIKGTPLYTNQHALQSQLCVQLRNSEGDDEQFLGPYIALCPDDKAKDFEQLVSSSIERMTRKDVSDCLMPQFLFLSDPVTAENIIDYPRTLWP